MSKEQKQNIIRPSLKGSIFNSFASLGTALGFKAMERPAPERKNCRRCGAPMRQIPGTNIWVCDGTIEEKVDKQVRQKPCGNRVIASARSIS